MDTKGGKSGNNNPGLAANGVLANRDERLDPSGYRRSMECRVVVQCTIRQRRAGGVGKQIAAVVWRCCGCGRGSRGVQAGA